MSYGELGILEVVSKKWRKARRPRLGLSLLIQPFAFEGVHQCPHPIRPAITSTPPASPAARPPSAASSSASTTTPPAARPLALRPPPSGTPFDVPAIVDPETLQMTLSEIIRRLADNTLDTKRASLLLITLQMAKANLPAIPRYPYEPSEEPTRDSASRTAQSPDFPDLSGLLSILGLPDRKSVLY